MERVYITDDGHEMDEADFLAYLLWKIESFVAGGLCKANAISLLAESDFWGDSILDENGFERIIEVIITYNKIVIK